MKFKWFKIVVPIHGHEVYVVKARNENEALDKFDRGQAKLIDDNIEYSPDTHVQEIKDQK